MKYLMMEPMASAVSDRELILVASFCGRDIAEKLLFEGDEYRGLFGSTPSVVDRGDHLEFSRGDNPGNRQAEGFSA